MASSRRISQPWLTWVATAMYLCRLTDSSACSTDAGCVSACSVATPSGPCTRTACDTTFGRCACGDEAALLTNGGCVGAPPITVGGCQLGYSARMFAAVTASPELQPADLTSSGGRASAALVTILRRSVAAGLTRDAHEVVSMNVQMTAARRLRGRLLLMNNSFANSTVTNSSPLLQVDLTFEFCIGSPALQLDSLGSAHFDAGFDREIFRYAAMSAGTVRVQQIVSTATVTSTTSTTAMTARAADDAESDGTNGLASLWWVWWFLLIPLVVAAGCFWILMRQKHAKTVPYDDTELESADGPPRRVPSGPLQAELPRVCANVAFGRHDLSIPDIQAVQILTIEEGEFLEVMLNAGEWLYGRRLGRPQEIGYFPESHVSWLGRPVAEPGGIDQSEGSGVAPETIGLPQSTLRDAGQVASPQPSCRVLPHCRLQTHPI